MDKSQIFLVSFWISIYVALIIQLPSEYIIIHKIFQNLFLGMIHTDYLMMKRTTFLYPSSTWPCFPCEAHSLPHMDPSISSYKM
jgi:hypothetical protein